VASIRDVAQRARVGVSTVSKVLNGYSDIGKETRQKVLAAAKALDYRPNRAARSFRTGKTQTVSVFLPMVGTEFYERLITAIDHELAAHDYDAALFPLLSEQRLRRYRESDALPYHADGVIFASLNPDWLFPDARLPAPLPGVLVDAYHADYDTITVDNARGAFDATQHLLERPAPTYSIMIEHFADTPFASGVFIERAKGFERALETSGVGFANEQMVHAEFSRGGGRDAFREILKRTAPPINVFASCDEVARGVLDEVVDRGLRLGSDVRVVGFDDQPWAAEVGLSSVHQPVERLGARAAALLLARFGDPDAPVRHEEVIPTLVRRTSS